VCLTGEVSHHTLIMINQLTKCSGLTREMGLSSTGISNLQDSISLCVFSKEAKTPVEVFTECHFLAQISLQILINRIDNSLGKAFQSHLFNTIH
jgi:hypothetical protein